jgi:hypothetical protein
VPPAGASHPARDSPRPALHSSRRPYSRAPRLPGKLIRQRGDFGRPSNRRVASTDPVANHWGGELRRQYEDLSRQWLVLARLADQRRPPSG